MKNIINSFISDEPTNTKLFIKAYKSILVDPNLECAFKAYILNIPSYQDILNEQDILNIDKTYSACNQLKALLAKELENDYIEAYKSLCTDKFDLSADSMGARSFKNLCLKFISLNDKNIKFAKDQFSKASNMTDELSALSCLYNNYDDQVALLEFYNKWKSDTLVIQKWFALQANGSNITVAKLAELENNEAFDISVPNLTRALVGQFVANNTLVLTSLSGFSYALDKIIEVDKLNPQVASRLVKNLSIIEKLGKEDYSDLFDKYKEFKKNKFSKDVTEVLENIKV
jgi:aminopeptidase N